MNNETVQLMEQKTELFYQHSLSTTVLLVAISVYTVRAIQSSFGGVKAYKVGFRSPIKPAFLVRLRFSTKAFSMIKDGFSKVRRTLRSSSPLKNYGLFANILRIPCSTYCETMPIF